MSFGLGFGTAFGGSPLVPVEDQVAPIAGDPFTFDFTDAPDGPFPGMWEFYNWATDASGTVSVLAETDSASFFRVVDGLGLFAYDKQGSPDFDERGFAASPIGLVGRNGRVTVIARQPTQLLDGVADEFVYELVVGLRFGSAGTPVFVGGRVRARWASGWVDRLILETVTTDGDGNVSVLETATLPLDPGQDPLDLWETQDNAELDVVLRDTALTVTLSGVASVEAQVPAEGPAKAVILIRAYNRVGTAFLAEPVLAAVQLQSLRDFGRLGPPPQLPGDLSLEAPLFPMLRLAIDDLVERGLIRRVSARQFKVLQEFEATAQALSARFKPGEVIRVREEFVGQELVAVTRDLAAQRGRGGL